MCHSISLAILHVHPLVIAIALYITDGFGQSNSLFLHDTVGVAWML